MATSRPARSVYHALRITPEEDVELRRLAAADRREPALMAYLLFQRGLDAEKRAAARSRSSRRERAVAGR